MWAVVLRQQATATERASSREPRQAGGRWLPAAVRWPRSAAGAMQRFWKAIGPATPLPGVELPAESLRAVPSRAWQCDSRQFKLLQAAPTRRWVISPVGLSAQIWVRCRRRRHCRDPLCCRCALNPTSYPPATHSSPSLTSAT